MSDAEKRRLLSAVRKARERAEELKRQATDVQSKAVTEALAAGLQATEIASELGISRQRVYQLRDGV